MSKPKLLVLQGLPASGKSTYAKTLVLAFDAGYAMRINNDDLATTLFGYAFGGGKNAGQLLGKIRADLVRQAFRNDFKLVIMDNTNLNPKTIKSLRRLAESCGVDFELDDSFLGVPLSVCLERNAKRENPIPEKVIIEMARLIGD
jgi:predicted kinase